MKNNTAKDNYNQLVEEFISKLEHGVKPWEQSWNLKSGLPKSALTGGEYSGINLLSLMNSKFKSNKWITPNQIQKLGGSIKEEELENSRDIFFIKNISKAIEEIDEDTGEIEKKEEKYTVLKNYKVYNTDQVSGINFEEEVVQSKNEKIEEVEKFIANTKAQIYRGSPAYSPSDDAIFMPDINDFNDKENYYSTLFHELSHWSGHESRLNRKKATKKYDAVYGYEELIAELSSAFLCAKHKISMKNTQHSEYMDHWIKMLAENPYILFSVATHSSKSANYLSTLAQNNAKEQTQVKKNTKPKYNAPKIA